MEIQRSNTRLFKPNPLLTRMDKGSATAVPAYNRSDRYGVIHLFRN